MMSPFRCHHIRTIRTVGSDETYIGQKLSRASIIPGKFHILQIKQNLRNKVYESPFQYPAYEESPYSYRKDIIYTPDYQPTAFISINTLLTFFRAM